jgi:hypothetical protein
MTALPPSRPCAYDVRGQADPAHYGTRGARRPAPNY